MSDNAARVFEMYSELTTLRWFTELVADLKKDGEDGFVLTSDDAVDTLHDVIDFARKVSQSKTVQPTKE